MWTDRYLLMSYERVGKCFGLHALILKQERGVTIDVAALGMVDGKRKIEAVAGSEAWPEVARRENGALVFRDGEERPFDLVLLEIIAGRGRTARMLELHCGTVVEPGLMIDVERDAGVRLRPYRDIGSRRAASALRNRVVGIYRARELVQ